MERSPIMAKMFEKKMMYGSLVMAKTAGTESTAKIKSVNSMMSSTTKSGVIKFLPFTFTMNFFPTYVG